MQNPTTPIERIVICGGGLAGHMTAAALSRAAAQSVRITLVDDGAAPDAEILYGSVTPPTAYAFNLAAGVTEPDLVLNSDTAFSWGTRYQKWASGTRTWIQTYHLALPIIDGVQFHHYLAQQSVWKLEPFLASAVAGRNGAFAHPPQPGQQGAHPIARGEYGYQFDPAQYARLFAAAIDSARVETVRSKVVKVERGEAGIAAVRLADGQSLEADLFVDCTGPDAVLLSALGVAFNGARRVRAASGSKPAAQLGPPLRTIYAADYGWRAETPLRGRTARLTVYDPQSEDAALAAHGEAPEQACEATIGTRAEAWSGNCVAVGHAGCVIEPLTPAPIILLQNDVERLLSLIPSSREMSVERGEYNRRHGEDFEHAEIFNRALFETDNIPDTPYWNAAREEPMNEKLARKIELFQHRGFLVAYDLEPFNPEDWTILHYGMGRRAAKYDRSADRAPPSKVQAYLANMKNDIEKAVKTLPNHDAYMRELTQYLQQNRR